MPPDVNPAVIFLFRQTNSHQSTLSPCPVSRRLHRLLRRSLSLSRLLLVDSIDVLPRSHHKHIKKNPTA